MLCVDIHSPPPGTLTIVDHDCPAVDKEKHENIDPFLGGDHVDKEMIRN